MVALFSHTNKLRMSNFAYVLYTKRISPIVYSFYNCFYIDNKLSCVILNTLYFSNWQMFFS